MLIHKIVHLHQSLSEARHALSRIESLAECFADGIQRNADGTLRIEFALAPGPRAHAVLVQIPSASSTTILFGSRTGNVRIAGMVELVPIRETLTEIAITMDYEFEPFFLRAYDSATRAFDRFLSRQFSELRSRLKEFAVSGSSPAPVATVV
jgi:hypothetical protein